MNVDKMRHQLARTTEAAERHERKRWLASLTPQHRRVHEGPWQPFCRECTNANLREMNRIMLAAMRPATRS